MDAGLAVTSKAVAVVELGMTRRQVRRLLGNPNQLMNDRRYRRLYSRSGLVLGGWRRGRSEAWLYVDVPQAGRLTFVHFDRGRVAKVFTQRSAEGDSGDRERA
ncbi:outer membrane protein assembly factor BamE domain-containing protein [Micromonospora sp. URMC 103]|uniref:outer membrane protein assembly factor BamE domain-containing protein n=1 Tax=Micromonospora sp. URMC 103 TaxID=3423406 RepID=UPI003F1B3255